MNLTYNSSRWIGSVIVPIFLTFGIVATSSISVSAQSSKAAKKEMYSSDYQNIDVATFDQFRKSKDYTKLDVRSSDAVALNRLGGSVEIDYSDASFVSELKALDKDKNYLVFCEDGVHSAKVAQNMIELGFKNVFNLVGGFASWSATERPPE